MPTLPPYPKNLTSAEWNKKRGLIAKIVAEPTKLSDQLRKTEAAYHAVPWNYVFTKPDDDATLRTINDQIAKAGAETKPKTTLLKNALTDLKTQAGAVKQTWASNKLVPKDVKVYLDIIIATATSFMGQLDNELKGGMSSLFVAQQRREYLFEQEAKSEGVKSVKGKAQPKDKDGKLVAPKMKFTAAAKKMMNEEESSVVESEESGG